MKQLLLICVLFGNVLWAQNNDRKPLHARLINDFALVDNGYVFNLNAKTKTFISKQGFFDILAQAKDTLLISSLNFKSRKIIVSENDFLKPLALFDMESQLTALKEVVVKGKLDPKPSLPNTQKIVDMKFISDEKSAVKNSAMPSDRSIENGLDFVRVFKMLKKAFSKKNGEVAESNNTNAFPELVLSRIDGYFFTNTLKLAPDEVNLFLDYCKNDTASSKYLKDTDTFLLMDFLVNKNKEFKRFTTFEK